MSAEITRTVDFVRALDGSSHHTKDELAQRIAVLRCWARR